jgi:flagellar biosynthetic protein FliP
MRAPIRRAFPLVVGARVPGVHVAVPLLVAALLLWGASLTFAQAPAAKAARPPAASLPQSAPPAVAAPAAQPSAEAATATGAGGAVAAGQATPPKPAKGGGGKVVLSVEGADDGQLGLTVQIVLLMTVLSLAPAIVMLTTSFTRILIVLAFLRQAIGTQQMPSNQILVGLSLFLSLVVMGPVAEQIKGSALDPYLAKEITQKEAVHRAVEPIRHFMLHNTREKDLQLFVDLSHAPRPDSPEALPMSVVVPGFLTSELKTAFQMGFLIYLPFLVVDMVVASVLMSMGMMMLPPVLISLPFKVLLFVMVDGWHLAIKSLVSSFHTT